MIDLQIAGKFKKLPTASQFKKWVAAALNYHETDKSDIVIRIVDETESATLNQQYRQKKGPTNVLSFPFEDPPGVTTKLLGDLIICAPVIMKEALEQGKTLSSHWAHIVIHGTLHLLGYDHIKKRDAVIMEGLEIKMMAELGYDNPYEV